MRIYLYLAHLPHKFRMLHHTCGIICPLQVGKIEEKTLTCLACHSQDLKATVLTLIPTFGFVNHISSPSVQFPEQVKETQVPLVTAAPRADLIVLGLVVLIWRIRVVSPAWEQDCILPVHWSSLLCTLHHDKLISTSLKKMLYISYGSL